LFRQNFLIKLSIIQQDLDVVNKKLNNRGKDLREEIKQLEKLYKK